MTTATAVLASVPASYRVKRNEIGGAERQLRYLDQQSADFAVKQLAYGVLYADSTGRTTGSVSMALRRSTAWQAAQLVVAMRKDGVELIADVSRWLNANALAVLSSAANVTTCEPPLLVATGRQPMRYIKETGGEARHHHQ